MKRVVVEVPLLAIGGQFFLCCIAMYLVMLICSITTLVSRIYVPFVLVSFTKNNVICSSHMLWDLDPLLSLLVI